MRLTRRIVAAALIIAATAGGSLSGSETASAWKYGHRRGRTGEVYVPQAVFSAQYFWAGGTLPDGTPIICCWNLTPTTNNWLTVSRVPRVRGTQTVLARQIVQKWNGSSWDNLLVEYGQGTIGPRQTSVRFRSPTFRIPQRVRGHWRMIFIVGWASPTEVLGASLIIPSRARDMRCQAWVGGYRVINCTESVGNIYVHSVGF